MLLSPLPQLLDTPVIGCDRVRLMNDLEATAYGALFLSPNELQTLNAGSPRRGHRAVIAAGTGLGQAFLFWDGMRYRPVATEGGHADFAPRDEQEVELLYFLRKRYSRVSYERLLAGPGLVNIFNFLDQALHRPVAPSVRERLQTARTLRRSWARPASPVSVRPAWRQ
jgi:glucokinase